MMSLVMNETAVGAESQLRVIIVVFDRHHDRDAGGPVSVPSSRLQGFTEILFERRS